MDVAKSPDQVCRERDWTYVGLIAREISKPYNVVDFIVRTYCKSYKVKKAEAKAAGVAVGINLYANNVKQIVIDRLAQREARMRDAVEVSVKRDVIAGEFDDLAREVAQIHEDSRAIAGSLSQGIARVQTDVTALEAFRAEVEKFMRDVELKLRGIHRELDQLKSGSRVASGS
jgi:hypothetical protein